MNRKSSDTSALRKGVPAAHDQKDNLHETHDDPAAPPLKSQHVTSPGRGWTIYIIESASGKLYTGITTDMERRFDEHATDPKKGARFFRTSRPKKIVYTENGLNRSEAGKREAEIKRMTRAEKLELISSKTT